MFDDDTLSDDDLTPVTCAACGGDFAKSSRHPTFPTSTTYALVACRWCTRGAQTPRQRSAWERHKAAVAARSAAVRASGVRRRPSVPPAKPIGRVARFGSGKS